MKIRSFLAFDLPTDVRSRLAAVVDDFRAKEKAVTWTDSSKMHVTIKFLGAVDEELLLGEISSKIEGVVKGFSPATLECQGLGVIPNWKYPKVIWAGFNGDIDKIINWHRVIDNHLSPFDLNKDKREFRLHLTLGRTKNVLKKSPIINIIEKIGPVAFGRVRVEKLILYKSVLTKEGPVYTPLREFQLLG